MHLPTFGSRAYVYARNMAVKLYRGMPDKDMHLLTSLQRLLGDKDGRRGVPSSTARRLEEGMVETFRKCVQPKPLQA